MIDSLDIRFANALGKRLAEDITAAHDKFASGTWINHDDSGITAMNAMGLYHRIQGLKIALKRIEETHKALTGKGEPRKEREPA